MKLNIENKANILLSEILKRNGKNFSWLAEKLEVAPQSISASLAKDRRGLKIQTLVRYIQTINPSFRVEISFRTEKVFFLYVKNQQSVIVHSMKYD